MSLSLQSINCHSLIIDLPQIPRCNHYQYPLFCYSITRAKESEERSELDGDFTMPRAIDSRSSREKSGL